MAIFKPCQPIKGNTSYYIQWERVYSCAWIPNPAPLLANQSSSRPATCARLSRLRHARAARELGLTPPVATSAAATGLPERALLVVAQSLLVTSDRHVGTTASQLSRRRGDARGINTRPRRAGSTLDAGLARAAWAHEHKPSVREPLSIAP